MLELFLLNVKQEKIPRGDQMCIRFSHLSVLVLLLSSTDCASATDQRPQRANVTANESGSADIKALIDKVRDKSSPGDRIKTMETLKALGPEAKDARTVLCEALLDLNPNVRMAASEALETIAPKLQKAALPLAVQPTKTSPFLPGNCAIELRKMGEEGKPARALIWQRYKTSDDVYTRRHCLEALCSLFPDDQQIGRQVYLVASQAKGSSTDEVAISNLPRMKHVKVDEGVRLLMVMIRDNKKQGLRVLAIKTLADYEKNASPAIDVLRRAKGDSSSSVRKAAKESLEKIEAAISDSKKVPKKP